MIQQICQDCQKLKRKEEGGNQNMDIYSNGSHRDDVSQSTMAARSHKNWAEGNTLNST